MSWYQAIKSASGETWRRSIREVIVIAVISLFPLLARFVWFYFRDLQNSSPHGILTVFAEQVLTGQILLFSISNFAAVFWLSQQEFRHRFDERVWFSLVSVIGWGICAFLIGFNPDFDGVPQKSLHYLSGIVFAISIVANIMMLVFANFSGVDFSNAQSNSEAATATELDRRRNG